MTHCLHLWQRPTRELFIFFTKKPNHRGILEEILSLKPHFTPLPLTSVNSISSIPSPVYQCKKALRLNIAVNCSPILLNSSWIAVLLPMNVEDILSPRGGTSQTAVLTLFGIHSTKYELGRKIPRKKNIYLPSDTPKLDQRRVESYLPELIPKLQLHEVSWGISYQPERNSNLFRQSLTPYLF